MSASPKVGRWRAAALVAVLAVVLWQYNREKVKVWQAAMDRADSTIAVQEKALDSLAKVRHIDTVRFDEWRGKYLALRAKVLAPPPAMPDTATTPVDTATHPVDTATAPVASVPATTVQVLVQAADSTIAACTSLVRTCGAEKEALRQEIVALKVVAKGARPSWYRTWSQRAAIAAVGWRIRQAVKK